MSSEDKNDRTCSTDNTNLDETKNRDLDVELLEMFGEKIPSTEPALRIDAGIVKWWKEWMSKGLSEEDKKEVLKKYPRDVEFPAQAPKINLEVNVI